LIIFHPTHNLFSSAVVGSNSSSSFCRKKFKKFKKIEEENVAILKNYALIRFMQIFEKKKYKSDDELLINLWSKYKIL
jgi:hypothetical protein